jgi:NAD(P)-dependent dehydrogenase (short-subunit alcohol dehydrogenase family)
MPPQPIMQRFAGQSVLVTGGANGLGLSTAQRFAAEGATVWIADIDPATPERARSFGASGVICDVSSREAIDALVSDIVRETARFDVAVANAGIAGGAPVVALDDALYRRIMSINLDGVVYTCRAAARAMTGQGAGSIIAISSVFGREAPAGSAAYSAAKAGVVAFVQSLSRELAPEGIRVNAIAPGHMMTELYERAVARRAERTGKSAEQVFAEELAAVPMGRFGTGDDVAGLVAFLASEDAAYITGQTINVDGGLQSR